MPIESAPSFGFTTYASAAGSRSKVLGAVDGRDHGEARGAQLHEVLLPRHVGASGEFVVDAHALRERAGPEVVVGGPVVQDGTAVADHDRVEAVHQGGGVTGVAQSEVGVLAEPRGQLDVLVAVPPPPRAG